MVALKFACSLFWFKAVRGSGCGLFLRVQLLGSIRCAGSQQRVCKFMSKSLCCPKICDDWWWWLPSNFLLTFFEKLYPKSSLFKQRKEGRSDDLQLLPVWSEGRVPVPPGMYTQVKQGCFKRLERGGHGACLYGASFFIFYILQNKFKIMVQLE